MQPSGGMKPWIPTQLHIPVKKDAHSGFIRTVLQTEKSSEQ